VKSSLQASACESPTMAINDAYAKRQTELESCRRELRLPLEAVGVAVFQGPRLCGIDLFDRHETLAYFWDSLLDSYMIDLLGEPFDPAESGQSGDDSDARQVTAALERAAAGRWEPFDSPGEGSDWRLDEAGYSGSSLVWDERVVLHLQLFPVPPEEDQQPDSRRPRIHRRWLRSG
jgi:hypothetical protein